MWYILFAYNNHHYFGVGCYLKHPEGESGDNGKSIVFWDENGHERSLWYNDAEMIICEGGIEIFSKLSELRRTAGEIPAQARVA